MNYGESLWPGTSPKPGSVDRQIDGGDFKPAPLQGVGEGGGVGGRVPTAQCCGLE